MIKFYEKLDYGNVEFQNRDISLDSLRNETKCWKVCEKETNAHFDLQYVKRVGLSTVHLRLDDKLHLQIVISQLGY